MRPRWDRDWVVHTAGVSPSRPTSTRSFASTWVGVALVLEQFGEVIETGGAGVAIASMAGHFHPAMDRGSSNSWRAPRRGTFSRSRRVLPRCSTVQEAYGSQRANHLRSQRPQPYGASVGAYQLGQPRNHLDSHGHQELNGISER